MSYTFIIVTLIRKFVNKIVYQLNIKISGGFGGISLFWYGVALYNLNASGLMGSSMKTHLLVDMVCLATAAAANLLNFVMGILQIKEADEPPTGPPPS